MDSITSPKVKTMEGGVGAHSLVHDTSGVKGHVKLRDGTRKNDKKINYSHEPVQTKQHVD
jgi:hypothetical protein